MNFNDRDRRQEISERMAGDVFAELDAQAGSVPIRGTCSDETWARCVDIVKGDALQRWQIAAKTFEAETRERGRQRIIDAAEKLRQEKNFVAGIWGDRARSDYGPSFDDMPLEQQVRLANEIAENWETDR